MKPINPLEILPLTTYDHLRSLLRPLCIAEKSRHRLAVGQHLTLLFENRQTIWYQIHEVLRAERISDNAGIDHEIETYNELIPRPGELSATLLIEYVDAVERDTALARLVGLERHLWLVFDKRRIGVRFDERQISPSGISSVQFIAFGLGADAQRFEELAAAGRVEIETDHPHLQARAAIGGALAAALAEDLRPD